MAAKLEVPKPLEDEEGREVTPRSSRKVIGLQSFFHHLDEAYEKKVAIESREKGGALDEETQQGLLGSEPVPFDLSSSSSDSESDSEEASTPAKLPPSDSRASTKPSSRIPLEKITRASSTDSASQASPASPSGAKRTQTTLSPAQSPKNRTSTESNGSTPNGANTGTRVLLSAQPRSHTLISPSSSSQTASGNSSAAKRASAVGSLKSFWENLNEKERHEADRLRVKPTDVGRANRSVSGVGHGIPAYTRTDSTTKLFGALNSPISPRGPVSSSPRIYHASEQGSPTRNASEVPKSSSLAKSAEGLTNGVQYASPRLNSPRASSAVLSVNSPRKTVDSTQAHAALEKSEPTVEPVVVEEKPEPSPAQEPTDSAQATAVIAVNTPTSKKSKPSRSSSKVSADGETDSAAASPASTPATAELTKKTKRSSRKRSASPRSHETDSAISTAGRDSGANEPSSPSLVRKSTDVDDSVSQETNTTSSSKHSKSASRKASSISAEAQQGRSEINGDSESAPDPRDIQSDAEGYQETTKDRKKKHLKGDTPRANSTSHIASKERVRKSSAGASTAVTASPEVVAKSSSKRGEIAPIYLNAQSSPELNFNPDTLKKQHSKTEVTSGSTKYTKTNSKADVKAESPRDKKKKSKRGSAKSAKDGGETDASSQASSVTTSTAASVNTSPEVPVKAGRKKKKSKKKHEDDSSTPSTASVSTAVATTQALTASGNGQIELGKLKSFFSNWESTGMVHSWEINPQEIEFVELIGEGTSCAVYKGTYRGQEVALKVLKDINTKQLTNFVKEFDIVSVFRSPHVVFFFGACIEPVPVMVLGLCAKGSLYDVLKRPDSNLAWANVIKVSISTLRGLDSLHKWKPQILHRDLKSRNILVEDDWTAKLCDFGESRYNTGTNIDTLCKIRGTYAYISPEVYFGQSFTPKSDVYAFGVILWELCNRSVRGVYQAPFAEYKALIYDFQIIVQASRKGMRPTIAAGVPPALANVIRLCWDHEPANRPTAAQLLKFFEEISLDSSHPENWEKAKHAFPWPPPNGPGVAGAAPTTKGD